MKNKTPKERLEERRKKLTRFAGNLLVLLLAIAGVLLADPWQQYRSGEVPQFVSPETWLEIVFAFVVGIGIVEGVQEFGGDPIGKHKRLLKRCIMAFVAGAGIRTFIR